MKIVDIFPTPSYVNNIVKTMQLPECKSMRLLERVAVYQLLYF